MSASNDKVPHESVAASNVDWRPQFVDGLSLDMKAGYQSAQTATVNNRVRIPARATIDFAGRYRFKLADKEAALRVVVTNILDKSGFDSKGAGVYDIIPRDGAIETQFIRANIDPTERYVQSPPGSTQFRMRPWDTGFLNLLVAGDWTYTGLNVGSVECAVMSGRLVSNAITGSPPLSAIPGYLAS